MPVSSFYESSNPNPNLSRGSLLDRFDLREFEPGRESHMTSESKGLNLILYELRKYHRMRMSDVDPPFSAPGQGETGSGASVGALGLSRSPRARVARARAEARVDFVVVRGRCRAAPVMSRRESVLELAMVCVV